jgi:hypothetical protein
METEGFLTFPSGLVLANHPDLFSSHITYYRSWEGQIRPQGKKEAGRLLQSESNTNEYSQMVTSHNRDRLATWVATEGLKRSVANIIFRGHDSV